MERKLNTALLKPDVQDFIRHFSGDTSRLAFSGSPFPEIDVRELLEQIESRRKIEKKLPTWYRNSNICYPPKLNLEQTSSEQTAAYKAEIVKGRTMVDLTGGFGVDSYFFSKKFERVDHFETNEYLSALAKHNFKELNIENVTFYNEDGISGIKDRNYDLIYVDPSRRTAEKRKVFLLEDYTPDILGSLSYLLKRTKVIMVKTSPMLDISLGIKSFGHVAEIHVVAVDNEVKELLWILTSEINQMPKIVAVNLLQETMEQFEFNYGDQVDDIFSYPMDYLYEPNASIYKSGGFAVIAEKFRLNKLHKHSHLFTGKDLIDFPGRRFRIVKTVPYSKKAMKTALDFEKANITVRNFPESVEAIRKKWKIKDGGDIYVFFTTVANNEKMMLLCEKITK